MRELLALLLSAFRRSDDFVESSLAPYAGLDEDVKPVAGLLNPDDEPYPGLTSESATYLKRVK